MIKTKKSNFASVTKVDKKAYIDIYHGFTGKRIKTVECLFYVRFKVLGDL